MNTHKHPKFSFAEARLILFGEVPDSNEQVGNTPEAEKEVVESDDQAINTAENENEDLTNKVGKIQEKAGVKVNTITIAEQPSLTDEQVEAVTDAAATTAETAESAAVSPEQGLATLAKATSEIESSLQNGLKEGETVKSLEAKILNTYDVVSGLSEGSMTDTQEQKFAELSKQLDTLYATFSAKEGSLKPATKKETGREFFEGINLSDADKKALGKALAAVLEFFAKVLTGKEIVKTDEVSAEDENPAATEASESSEAEKNSPDKVRLQAELTKHVQEGGAGVDSLIKQKEQVSAGIEANRVAAAADIENLEDDKAGAVDQISDLKAQKTVEGVDDATMKQLDEQIAALETQVKEIDTQLAEKETSLVTLAKERDTTKEASVKDVNTLREMQTEATDKHAQLTKGLENLRAIPKVESITFLKGITLNPVTADLQITIKIPEEAASLLKQAEQTLGLESFDSTNPITDTEGFVAHIGKVIAALLAPKDAALVDGGEKPPAEENQEQTSEPSEDNGEKPPAEEPPTPSVENGEKTPPENTSQNESKEAAGSSEFTKLVTDAVGKQKEFMEHVGDSLQRRIDMYNARIIDTQKDISALEKQWFTGGTVEALKNTLQQEEQALQTAKQALVEFNRVETSVNESIDAIGTIDSKQAANEAIAVVNKNNDALNKAFNMKRDPNYAQIGEQLQAAADSLAWADNAVDTVTEFAGDAYEGISEAGANTLAYLQQIPGAAGDIWEQDFLPALNSIKDSEAVQSAIAYVETALDGIQKNGIDGQVTEAFAALRDIAAANGLEGDLVDKFIDSIESVASVAATTAEVVRESGEALYTGSTENMDTTDKVVDTVNSAYKNTVSYISSIPDAANQIWQEDLGPALESAIASTNVSFEEAQDYVATKYEEIKNGVTGAAEDLQTQLAEWGVDAQEAVGNFVNSAIEEGEKVVDNVTEGASNAYEGALAYIGQIPGAAGDIWEQDLLPALNNIKDSEAVQSAIAYVETALDGIQKNGIDGQVTEAFAALREIAAANGIDGTIVNSFIDGVESVASVGATTAEVIRESGEALYTGSTENMDTTDKVVDTVNNAYEGAIAYIGEIPGAAQDLWDKDVGPALASAGVSLNEAQAFIEKQVQAAKEGSAEAYADMQLQFAEWGVTIDENVKNFITTVTQTAESTVNSVNDSVDNVIDNVNSVVDNVAETANNAYESTVTYIESIPESAQNLWRQDIVPAFEGLQNNEVIVQAGTIIGETIANIEQNGISNQIDQSMIALQLELNNLNIDQSTVANIVTKVEKFIVDKQSTLAKKEVPNRAA